MIEKAKRLGMKDYVASRLHHVLSTKPTTYAELFDLTVMVRQDRRVCVSVTEQSSNLHVFCLPVKCFVPIKGGSRKKKYDLKNCKICKAAGELVDRREHDCPYCPHCFSDSGWKKLIVLADDCNEDHTAQQDEASDNDGDDGNHDEQEPTAV